MRVCYIDDNEECLNNFKDKYKDVLCENDFSFMRHPNEYIGSEDVADIVMLDVELGSEGNGLDYLDCITKKSGYTQIVIVTAYTEKYIEDIFMQKENVAGFLKKPIDMETMVKVLAKAEMIIRNKKAEVIVRTGKYEYVTLKADDILFIESAGHNLNYITRTKEYTTQGKLDDLNGQLPPFLSDVTRAILSISIKSKASRVNLFL